MLDSFNYYNHLGFYSKFYTKANEKIATYDLLQDALKVKNTCNYVNITSIVSILNKGFIIGDGTIINDVFKSPWMAKPNTLLEDWDYFKVAQHKEKILPLDDIGDTFLNLLRTEIIDYVSDKKKIGVLLTGGMDSRIIAGVLDSLIKDNEISDIEVTGLTWGNKNSRDVVYAERIANRMNWQWKHIENTAEDLKNNIELSAIRGSEYSPIHLHAMFKVRQEKNLDCILAGSFGDSIGRGEYSSRTVVQLKEIRKNINNDLGFLKSNIVETYLSNINTEVEKYWKLFKKEKSYQQIEQDYQIHYMRRLLNSCLSVVNEEIPLYQVFSSPKVLEFIWSLSHKLRDNSIYKNILSKFPTDLTDIPWARTGLIYDKTSGKPDEYEKSHHSYSDYINEDLFEHIKKSVLSSQIESLGVFNMKTLEILFKYMKSKYYVRNKVIEERIIWMASLSRTIEMYDIKSNNINEYTFSDSMNKFLPIKDNLIVNMKNIYRKLR